MKITIPFKTPSVNHLYFNWKGRQILTKEARELKKEIKDIVTNPRDAVYFNTFDYPNLNLKVSVNIYENWFNQDGTIKKKDLSNREKFLIDAVFEALGIEDKYIFEETMRKVQSETEEKAEITIEVL